MDKYFKTFPRLRGGDVTLVQASPAKTLFHNEIFGVDPSSVFWLKVSGIWKQCTAWIKISGVWKSATPSTRVSGTWL